MNRVKKGQFSPALVVATVALVAAVAGVAIAGPVANRPLTKSQAKKLIDKEIKKKAAGLSVAHAGSADMATNAGHAGSADSATNAGHATSADTAGTANPVAFAEIEGDTGDVIEANSRGITDANVVADPGGTDGHYCFKGLPFTPKSVQVTSDDGGPNDELAALLDPSGCEGLGVAGTQLEVLGFSAGADQDLDFFIWIAAE